MRTAFSFSHTWFPYYSFQLPDCSETKFLACLKPEKKFTHASLYTWLVLDDTLVFPQRNDKSRETKNWRCKGLHSGDDRFKSGWGLCIHFRDRVKAPGKSELHWTWSGTVITIRLWDHFTFLGKLPTYPSPKPTFYPKGAFHLSELASRTITGTVILTMKSAFSRGFCWRTISFLHTV